MRKKLAMLLLAGSMALGMVSPVMASSNPGSYSLLQGDTLLQVQVALDGALAWNVEPTIGGDSVSFLNGSLEGDYWTGNFIASGVSAGSSRIEILCMIGGVLQAHYVLDVFVSENYADLEVTNAYGDVFSSDDSSSSSTDSGSSDSGSSGSGSADTGSSSYVDASDFGDPSFSSYTAYVTAEGGLNMRRGNGSGYEVVTTLGNGQSVRVVGMTSDGWAMIVANDLAGYCNAAYLSTTAPGSTQTEKTTEKATEKTTEKTTEKSASGSTSGSTGTTKSETSTQSEEDAEPWYELTNANAVLSMQLPLEDETTFKWNYEISDEKVVSLLTQDDGEIYWAGSFIGTKSKAGIVTLDLTKQMDDSEDIYGLYDIKLNVTKDGVIKVMSAEENWLSVEPESGVLTLNLPGNEADGYAWSFDIEDESVAELVTSNYETKDSSFSDIDGYWAGSFRGLAEGETTIQFAYYAEGEETPEEVREVEVAVDADSRMTVKEYRIEK